ncbi:MAG: hypothetical protein ACLTE2_10070 [Eubacteriales bacterium]
MIQGLHGSKWKTIPYKVMRDLRGKKVAVKVGTEGATLANKLSEQYGFSVVTFDDSANMYEKM